jgi:Pyruvate/2-oxoacid:ferredoxin oxidoreductase delta subunit
MSLITDLAGTRMEALISLLQRQRVAGETLLHMLSAGGRKFSLCFEALTCWTYCPSAVMDRHTDLLGGLVRVH